MDLIGKLRFIERRKAEMEKMSEQQTQETITRAKELVKRLEETSRKLKILLEDM